MIRNPYGRAAVLRGVSGSLIRSPWRLLAVVTLLALDLIVFGWVLEIREEPGSSVSAQSGTSTASPDRIAWGFTVAWVTHPSGTTSAEWVHRLKPYTADSFIPELQSVNPDNVPSQALTGSPRLILVGENKATVDVPTDEVVLRLQLDRTSVGWRVISYGTADEGE